MPDPSPSLLRRIFGHDPLATTEEEYPGIRAAWSGREIEFPEESSQVNRIRPMNFLTKLLNPDAYAATSLFGTIGLNRENIERDKQSLPDVLTHELAHIGQGKKGFLRRLYEPRKVEDEAVDKEANRKVRRGDIYLRGR